MKRVYKKSLKIFIINDFVRKKIEESNLNFSFSNNIVSVPVGVDVHLFNKEKVAEGVSIEDYIISVGAIKSRKGQLESIKAFCSISDMYPNLKYLLIGSIEDSPDYYKQIKDFLRSQSSSNKVIFLQSVSDEALVNLYSNALFFVLTPRSTKVSLEGFGMVYIESALCGITSIGTFDSGAVEAIREGKSGVLVQNTVPEIAGAIRFLLEKVEKREEFAVFASRRALNFSWDYVIDQYENELSKLN